MTINIRGMQIFLQVAGLAKINNNKKLTGQRTLLNQEGQTRIDKSCRDKE